MGSCSSSQALDILEVIALATDTFVQLTDDERNAPNVYMAAAEKEINRLRQITILALNRRRFDSSSKKVIQRLVLDEQKKLVDLPESDNASK